MMKITTKEKLNDKARKMIDLIYDEVCNGGEESITSSFIGKKTGLKYKLTVGIEVFNPAESLSPEGPTIIPEDETNGEEDLYDQD